MISAVVPVFNGAAYLAECLDSIRAQSRPVDELFVVDDGSTDDSAEVAERFGGVRVLRRTNQGSGQARNAGIAASTGDLIAFLDADDRWLPTKIERQVEYLAAHPEVACVLCRSEIDLAPGMEMPGYLAPDVAFGDPGGVSPVSGLFRRQLLDELGGFGSQAQGQDFDLLVRARELGARIEVLDEQLAVRRVHDANWTRQFGSFAPGMLSSVREHLRRNQ